MFSPDSSDVQPFNNWHSMQNILKVFPSQTISYLVALSTVDDVFHGADHFLPLCFQGPYFPLESCNLERNYPIMDSSTSDH